MPSESLVPGLTGRAETLVKPGNLATDLCSGTVGVFATPALVGLMESAAVAAVEPHLLPGETTVGTVVNVRHLAATPPGMEVWAEAVLREVEGRRMLFDVSAYDEREKIGEGVHERFVILRERFMAKALGKGA